MSQRGNVFLYVLIAVVLFGGLTYSITQINQQTDPAAEVDESRSKIGANAILAWMASAQNVINNMDQVGTTTDEILYTRPSDATFNTAPHVHKLFHPDGGGLLLKAIPKDAMGPVVSNPANGYYVGLFSNVQWTPTAADDVMAVAYGISQAACAEINRKITGSTTIPNVTGGLQSLFIDVVHNGGTPNADFTTANCAACDERPALCVTASPAGSPFIYYSVLVAR